MFYTVVMVIAVFISGAIVGAILHEGIAKKPGISKTDVWQWSMRLRSAMTTEGKAAEEKLRALVADIEKKL